MPRPKKGHNDYRMACCFFCLRKGESKADRPLTGKEIELIIKHFLPNFKIFEDFLPLGCCSSCRNNLFYRFGTNKDLAAKYKPFPCESDQTFYQNVIDNLKKLPRGSGTSQDCKCFIL